MSPFSSMVLVWYPPWSSCSVKTAGHYCWSVRLYLPLKCYSNLCFSLHSSCYCINSSTYSFFFCGSSLICFPDLSYPLIHRISSVVVPNWEKFYPPGEIWQCLETYLVVTTGGASSWERLGMLPDIAQCTRQSPQMRNYLVKVSTVQILKNTVLEKAC